MKIKTEALVLRDYKIEGDRILTLLCEDLGVLTAYAGGANRMRSQLSAPTELFCFSEFVLFKNRDRYSVDGAASIRSFFGLRGNIEHFALASYFAELTAELASREDAAACQRLLLNTLHFLEKETRSASLLKPLFELRLLSIAGYMPNLVSCRSCGAYDGKAMRFFPLHGDLLCADCAASGEDGPGITLPPAVLAAMRHILYSEPDRLFSFTLSAEGLDALGRISERYLKTQLDRTFPTLEFYTALR